MAVQETGGIAKNLVLFKRCSFNKNSGRNGGGLYLHAENDNKFQFHECIWTENKGTHGTAILISHHYSTKDFPASFRSCLFEKNISKRVSLSQTMNATVLQYGRGALYANLFPITFSGNVTFIGNKRKSAIYLFSSTLEINAGSYVLFESNFGYQGGAINLRGLSSIHINDNVTIDFHNNSAWNSGGAIYHASLVDPSRLTEASCFIQYAGQHNKRVADRHATLHFVNNTIINHGMRHGQSIFLSSIISCKGENITIEKALNSTATFIFEDAIKKGTIETYPSIFTTTHENFPKHIIPGKETELGISATSDLSPRYRIETSPGVVSNITINPTYTIITNNVVKMQGQPKSKGRVILNFLEEDDLVLTFEVILDECPPGYIYNNQLSACQCSANTQTPYLGVTRCNSTAFQAYLIPGYWAGYVSNDASEQSFRTSGCPLGYCTTKFNGESEILLPARASSRDITDTVCVSSRMGVMCSECKKNTSARYNTQWTYDCGSEEKCHLGFLLFAVSQIVPVTILFLVVIFFDIQLNTGAFNGFLFFMQVLSIFNLTANNIIKVPKITEKILTALYSVIKAFNLDFFVIPGLDFCLFKGANPLDLLSFDYVLVVYSLLLVLFTITCLNRRCTTRVKRLRGRRILRTSSIIHGLSGFLVLCYVKTTTVTLRILTPAYIRGKGLRQYEIVNFYYGNISFFSRQHLKYAIPWSFICPHFHDKFSPTPSVDLSIVL